MAVVVLLVAFSGPVGICILRSRLSLGGWGSLGFLIRDRRGKLSIRKYNIEHRYPQSGRKLQSCLFGD